MAITVNKGTFTKSTAGAPVAQTIDTGSGEVIKFLKLFGVKASAVGFASQDVSSSHGFSDGTTEKAVGYFSDNITLNKSITSSCSGDKILCFVDGTETITAEADVTFGTGIDAGKFTITWTTNDTDADIIHYEAYTGSDITDVKVGEFTSNTATGNQAVTGVGFLGEYISLMSASNVATTMTQIHARIGFGQAISSTSRNTWGFMLRDNQNANKDSDVQLTDACLATLEAGGMDSGQIDGEWDFVSFDADGFTLNVVNAPDLADKIFYAVINGGEYDVGSFNQPTSTGTDTVTVGFLPKGISLSSWNKVADTVPAQDSSPIKGSYGAGTSSAEGGIWFEHDNKGEGAEQDEDINTYTDKVIKLASGPSTIDAEADLDSVTSTAFVLDWTTADATAREILYFAIGQVAITEEFTVDAILKATQTKTFIIDSILNRQIQVEVDARLIAVIDKTFLVDAILQATFDEDFTADALLNRQTTFLVDSFLQDTFDKDFIVDTFTQELANTKTFTIDSFIGLPAVTVRQGTVIKSTGGAPVAQTIDTGSGIEIKFIKLSSTRQTSEGFEGITLTISEGFSDGTNSRAISFMSEEGVDPTNTASRYANKGLTFIDSSKTTIAECDVSFGTGVDAGKFTLTWTTNDAVASIIHFVSYGGDTFDANVGTFTSNTSTGNQSITGVGFRGSMSLFLTNNNSGAAPNTVDDGGMCVGHASASDERNTVTFFGRDGQAVSNDNNISQRTDLALRTLQPTGMSEGNVDADYDFVSFDADGFTLNVIDAPAAATKIFYAVLKGGAYEVGAFNQPTSNGTQEIVTGSIPIHTCFRSWNEVASTSIKKKVGPMKYTSSGADFDKQGGFWFESDTSSMPMDNDVNTYTDRAILLASGDSTIDAEANYDSGYFSDAESFTLDWTDTDATVREILFWTVGEIAVIEKEFTVDAFLQDTFTETFLVDAILKATFTETFEVDAFLQDTFDEDFTVDAKLVQTEMFEVDARLAGTEPFEVDSLLAGTEPFEIDAELRPIKEFTIDARLAGIEEFEVDAKLVFIEQFNIDAKLVGTEAFEIDARLAGTEEFDVDAFLSGTEPFTVDAFPQAQQVFNFTVDGLRQQSPEEMYLIDAFIQETFAEDFETDSLLAGTEPFIVDAKIVRIERFSIDAELRPIKEFIVDAKLVFTETFTIDAKLNRQIQVEVDAKLVRIERFDIDSIVVDRNTETFTVDSFIQKEQTEDFLVDAFPQLQQVFNFTVDAFPQKEFTKLFLIDAVLRATFVEEFLVDSIVVERPDIDFTVDAQFEPQKIFCDFFNRPDSITLGASDIPGNVWVETEVVPGVGPEIVSNKLAWLAVQNVNNRNEPIAENNFTKQTSGKIKWQFQFDFDRGTDNDFRLTMQLGEAALMVDPNTSHTAGVAVNLQYASQSRGMTDLEGFGHGFEPSLVQDARTKGLVTVDVTADFGNQTYNINVRGSGFLSGANLTTGIPFVNGVDIDTIRIYSDLLSAIAFADKTFDDMCIFSVFETTESFAVDAVLKATQQKPFTVDAFLQDTFTETFRVDSLISAAPDKFFLVDVFLQKTFTETVEVDALIATRIAEGFTIDSVLRKTNTETFEVDALPRAIQAGDFTIDALLAEIKTKVFTVDGFLAEVPQELFTVDSLLQKVQTNNFTVDSRLAQINTETFTVDATNLFLTQTKEYTVDSLLKVLGQTDNFIVDSFVFDGQVKNVLVDSFLQKEQTETFTVQAELAFTATEDFEVDSLLKKEGNVETFTIDTILQVKKTFKIDGIVVRSGQASVDALLKGQNTKDFTVDGLTFIPPAVLHCIDSILVDRNTVTFDIDARIVNRFTKVFSVDALLPETKTVEFIVDTFTAQPTTKVFTVDSILAVANTKLFSVDTLLKGQNTVEFTVDTFKIATKIKLFPIDAKLRARQTETFTIDSLLSVSQTFDFTVDTVFKRQQFNNKTWDALIQELGVTKDFTVGVKTKGTQTETLDIDAVLKATFTNSFIVDGFPFIPPAISITIDPILLFTATETTEVDSKLINRKDTSFTIDAVLAVIVTNTKDFFVDSSLVGLGQTTTFEVDSILSTPNTVEFIVDTFLQRISTRSFLIDSSFLFNIFTEDFTIDSILKPVQFETFSVDSRLRKVQTELFDIDAEIASRNTTTFDVDSITFILPSKTFLIHGFPAKFGQTEQFTIEAHIRFVQSETFEVDSILTSVNVVTPFVDAFLQDVFTKDFTIDSQFVRTNTFAVDAFIQRLGDNCSLGSLFEDTIDSNSGWITLEAGNSINVDGVNFPGQIEYFKLGDFFNARTAKLLEQGQGGITTVDSLKDIKLNFKYQHDSSQPIGNLDGPIIMGLTDINDTSIKIFGQRNFSVVGRSAGGGLFKMRAQMFDGTIIVETGNIQIPNDVDVFVSMEKVGTFMRLNVTTDPAHLVHVPGSPTSFVSVGGLDQMIFNQLGASNTDILPLHMLETGRLDDIQVFGNICQNFNVDASIQGAPGKQFRIDSILSLRTEFTIDALLKAIGSNRCDSEKIFEDNFLTVSTWSNEINNTGVDGWGTQRIFIDGESASSEEILGPQQILNGFVRATLKPGGFLPAETPIFKTKYRRRKLIDVGGIGKINGSKFRIEFEFENIATGAGGTPLAFNASGLHAQDDSGPQLSFAYEGGASISLKLTDGINTVSTGGLNWSPSNGKRLFIVGEVDGADMQLTFFNDAEHTSIHASSTIVNVGGIQKNSLNLEWVILASNSKFSGASNDSSVIRLDDINVFSSPCPAISIDAHIEFKPVREFTIDAVIVRLEEFSIDASIIDPTVVNISEFEIDSILDGIILKEFTINGLLEKTKTKDVIVDGIIIRGVTFSVGGILSTIPQDLNFSLTHMQDITPLFSGIFDKTFSVDALLSGRIDFTIDARLRLVKRFDIDAFLTTPSTPLNFSLAHMQDIVPIFNMEVILPFNVDAILSTEEIQTFIVDADLIFEQTVDYIVDSIIAVSPTKIILIDTDSLLQKTLTKDVVIDSRVVERFIEEFTIDTFSIGQNQKSFTVDSLLKKIDVFNQFEIDSRLAEIKTFDFTINGILSFAGENGFCNTFPDPITIGTGFEQFTGPITPEHESEVELLIGQEFTLNNQQIRKITVLLRASDFPNEVSGTPPVFGDISSIQGIVLSNVVKGNNSGEVIEAVSDNIIDADSTSGDLPPGVWKQITFNFGTTVQTQESNPFLTGNFLIGILHDVGIDINDPQGVGVAKPVISDSNVIPGEALFRRGSNTVLPNSDEWQELIGAEKDMVINIELVNGNEITEGKGQRCPTMDALIAVDPKLFTVDAVLIIPKQFSFDINSLLKASLLKSFSVDSLTEVEGTKLYLTDSIVKAFDQKELITVDAILGEKVTINKPFTIDAQILLGNVRIRTDSLLIKTQTFDIFPDAILSAVNKEDYIVDGLIEGVQTVGFKVDTLLPVINIKTFDIDSQLVETQTLDFNVDSSLSGLNSKTFTVDVLLIASRNMFVDSILKALGDGVIGTGNNGSTNPFAINPLVDQQNGGNFFQLPLGTLVGQRLRLPTAPVRVTDYTFIMFRSNISGSPTGTITGKIYKQSIGGTPILVGDLIATSDNVINVADITTNSIGQFVTFTFTNPPEITQDDNIFIGFEISGSNENTFIETELTGTVIDGGDLNVEFTAGTWGNDLGIDTKVTINIDPVPRQRASALMTAFVGRFPVFATVGALLVQADTTESFRVDARLTGLIPKEFTIDAELRGRSFCIGAFVGDVFEIVLDCESVIAGGTSGVSTI